MKTTATNRKIRELLTALREGKLQPRPEFQRRLVWTNKDKCAFLQTVLLEYPFPEIYVAAGEVDLQTGEGKEMLVDGQQRITTLNQYFIGSSDLRLGKDIPAYVNLPIENKEKFLQYDVVVRDLGKMAIDQIKEVFKRINSTSYSLNAMEIHNARFEGEFKSFAEEIAQGDFFDRHRFFSAAEIRRMQDTLFVLIYITTIMSTYFNRDYEIEAYLERYNDEFDLKPDIEREISKVLDFVERCQFSQNSRVWKKADLFTLLVEIHRVLIKDRVQINHRPVASALNEFYEKVDKYDPAVDMGNVIGKEVGEYYKAALQATNDRGNRILRGQIIQGEIRKTL